MSELEFALFSGTKYVSAVAKIGYDECTARIICFEDTCSDGSRYFHRGALNEYLPALTIVVDLVAGSNPYEVAEIGL